jgi:hypothetical protein
MTEKPLAIGTETRKRLWARSGGRCAICRDRLIDSTGAVDTIVGEEAHIVARSAGGPRREYLRGEIDIDGYDNLMLLWRKEGPCGCRLADGSLDGRATSRD